MHGFAPPTMHGFVDPEDILIRGVGLHTPGEGVVSFRHSSQASIPAVTYEPFTSLPGCRHAYR